MAYVDSKLARLTPSHEAAATQLANSEGSTSANNTTVQKNADPFSASHGHLHQVDVTNPPKPSTTTSSTKTTTSTKRPRKPHWRNRRNSADLARDAMVDQILRESQLNIYEPSVSNTASTQKPPEDDAQDADERMAEEFKRNFYAAAEERAVRRAAPPPPSFGANKLESVKGPKLGGSRSQRAAMHAAEKAKALKK